MPGLLWAPASTPPADGCFHSMSTLRNSLLWSVGGRYLTLALQLLAFVVLARLLTPEDVGLYSVAAALIGLTQVLREFGVGTYLIQEKELTPARIRTAFTLSLLFSATLCLAVLVLARPIADFYREPRLEAVTRVLALSFLLIPFGSTALAILNRDMRFKALFWISTSSAVLSQLAALGFAALGFGYWSLVWSSLVATGVSVTGAAIAARGGLLHKPTLGEWRRVLNFGSQLVAGRIVSELSLSFNDLVVGRVLGLAEVGILSRAQGVMNLAHRDFLNAIRNVALPAFAKAHREGSDVDLLHAKFVANAAAFAWPFYGLLALFPLEALRLLFGPQWDAAAPLVPVFCAAGALAVLWSFASSALTACGHIGTTTRIELAIQPIRLGLLAACAYLFPRLEAFAWALLLVYALNVFVALGLKQTRLPTEFQRLFALLRPSVSLALATLSPAILVRALQAGGIVESSLAEFVTSAALCALAWMLALATLGHPLLDDPAFARIKTLLARIGLARSS